MNHLRFLVSVLGILSALGSATGVDLVAAQDLTKYCNAVQNNIGLIRYPLGTTAVLCTGVAEIADAMTQVPRVYPCMDSVVVRGEKERWSDSLSGDPSGLDMKYRTDRPSGPAEVSVTVTPHVSLFKVSFPTGSKKYLVLDFTKYRVDDWAALYRWTERSIRRVNDRTFHASVGAPGAERAFFVIQFSSPCTGFGMIDSLGIVHEKADSVAGTRLGMYAKFDGPAVTVAIAESFKSADQATDFLQTENADFDTLRHRCQQAWNTILRHVEIEGSELSKRMAYTALYTMLVNVIDGGDASCYAKYYARPRSLASSSYWQFIGGFQSCCWDNHRAAYPFLMLAYPEVMSDVVNTYLARYRRDGFISGDICLFTGPTGGHASIRLTPLLVSEAWAGGIRADYAQLYAALNDNYRDNRHIPESLTTLGYETQPLAGGSACSHTLEWSSSAFAMSQLARAQNDSGGTSRYFALSKSYRNLWDSTNLVFRVRNPDGSWGVIENKSWTWNPNPQGLFEGTNRDWMFSVPHDPYGLIELPGQKDFERRVIEYCVRETWFNDYQYVYPYLLYFAGAANAAQNIIRRTWVPLFRDGVMYEGVSPQPPHKPWNTHYTSNAGWLLCSMVGLYPMIGPAGQYIISSPSVEKAILHRGASTISVGVRNNSEQNIYVRSIRVDGKVYPCYMIPAKRLIGGAAIELEMGSDSTEGLGDLFVNSTDGYVESAELVSGTALRCTIEAAIESATTKVHSNTKPVKVLMNGREHAGWGYDERTRTLTVSSPGTACLEVYVR